MWASWLAGEVFAVDLPPDIADATTADPEIEALGRKALERLREGAVTKPADNEQHGYQWRALDNWPDRLVYATRIATIPSESDIESVALPRHWRRSTGSSDQYDSWLAAAGRESIRSVRACERDSGPC